MRKDKKIKTLNVKKEISEVKKEIRKKKVKKM